MKTAICGAWHVHAPEYTEVALKYSEVIGVYEPDEKIRSAFCEKFSIPAFSSLEELIASEAENVVVCSASESHANDIVKLALGGKNVFTEKVLALTVEDCEKIKDAVAKTGVKFVISLPQKSYAAPRTVKRIVESGVLGRINFVRFRNCHNGSSSNWLPPRFYSLKECGGGAMIDLGAHGMYLIDWLLGEPESYTSVFRTASDREDVKLINEDRVEDNAVTVMGYTDGAIAVNETGFVSGFAPQILEVGGERGSVRMIDGRVFLSSKGTSLYGEELPLDEKLPVPIVQFMTGEIYEGFGVDEAIRLTKMMVGAYKNVY